MKSRRISIGISAALIFALALPASGAPNSAKPSPTPQNGKGNTQGNGQGNSAGNAQGNSQGNSATNSTSSSNNSSNASATNNGGGSANSANNDKAQGNGNTSNGAQASPNSSQAKKSSNSKLNPANTTADKVNSSATRATTVRSRASANCKANTSTAKAKLEADPCSDFIIVFQPGLARSSSRELLKSQGAQLKREFSAIFNGAVVTGPLSKMQALANNPNVLVVEDDLEVTTTAIQTPAPWGLDRVDQRSLPLSNSYDDGAKNGVNSYAFVVDTGIDATNPEFAGRVAAGFTAIADGRGSLDCNGHGTHVAGIIGGTQYGVAKSTTLIPVRVLDCAGSGSYSSVIAGLDWIAANYRTGDAAVVNMSLGGPASSTLDGAVRTLISKGITVVVAAGNSAADACNYSPSRVLEAITVGATQSDDNRASYSNFGSCLDLFAPGTSITSAWIGGTNTISGTSMASPNVAGIVARFLATNPTLTPGQVANSLKNSATKGVVANAGSGSLNQLAYLEVIADTSTPVTVDPSPTFKKTNPRGRK